MEENQQTTADPATEEAPSQELHDVTYYTFKEYHGLYVYDQNVTVGADASAPANSTKFQPPEASTGQLVYWTGMGWMVGFDVEKVDLSELRSRALARAAAAFAQRVQELAQPYPRFESNSWTQMAQEARLYVQNKTPTPLLAGMAEAKGTTVDDVAASIISKADLYDEAFGKILGEFQVERARLLASKSITDFQPFRVTDLWVGSTK